MTRPYSRREVLRSLAATALGAHALAKPLDGLRIGIMDGIVGHASQPEAVDAAADLGLAGVQVTLGKPGASGDLPLGAPQLQSRFREAAKRRGIALPNTYLDVLHTDCLKNNSTAALRWIKQGLTITKALEADVLMLVFFNRCAIEEGTEQKAVIAPLREACRMAHDSGIILGFENTISAKDNLAILEAVDSPALKIWYDIGNSTNIGHFNVPEEIRLLRRERICAFHIKDKSYLDTGAVPVRGALEAIADIGFKGFAMLETSAPTGDHLADAKRNLEILRHDMATVETAR
jgi:L-ribulose-5-phosphate 3-epimerase